jgi:hypothetical protein
MRSQAEEIRAPSYTTMWGKASDGRWWWSINNAAVLVLCGDGYVTADEAQAAADSAFEAHAIRDCVSIP